MPPTTTEGAKAEIGERLRAERVRQGRSQTSVADAIGTDQKVVSRAEYGLTTLETQFRIASELGIDLMGAA